MNVGKITLIASAGILVAGTILSVVGMRPPPPRTFHGSVKDMLPKTEELRDWQVEFSPIADTPEMQAKVSELLNYDEAVFATYKNGAKRISIYIAYWAPGKMSHRLVAGHTPDVCWVGAGWKCEEGRSEYRFSDQRGGTLPPAEIRRMSLNGQIEHVAFWHMLDGVSVSYSTLGKPPWHAAVTDLLNRKLNQRPEQFFIRVSSNIEFKDWNRTELGFMTTPLSKINIPSFALRSKISPGFL